MCSRRAFRSTAAAASLSAAVKPDKNFKGVVIGAQTYSLRDRDVNQCLSALQELKINTVEMYAGIRTGNCGYTIAVARIGKASMFTKVWP